VEVEVKVKVEVEVKWRRRMRWRCCLNQQPCSQHLQYNKRCAYGTLEFTQNMRVRNA
jgi:hypothetical protein